MRAMPAANATTSSSRVTVLMIELLRSVFVEMGLVAGSELPPDESRVDDEEPDEAARGEGTLRIDVAPFDNPLLANLRRCAVADLLEHGFHLATVTHRENATIHLLDEQANVLRFLAFGVGFRIGGPGIADADDDHLNAEGIEVANQFE